mmetsp:Transcript_3647/g.6957  ORF Transcript_3647/g.6957 Transcript_3647/m.6957 type:complete len:207 (+) Transcript_3647:298-918(+)
MHKQRAGAALEAFLSAHLCENAKNKKHVAVTPVFGQFVFHHEQICGGIPALQKLIELEVHAQRIHDQRLVPLGESRKGRNDLRHFLQYGSQSEVVPSGIEARSKVLPKLVKLAQGMDSHECHHRIQGRLARQLHLFQHPVLDPHPRLARQLLVGSLPSDKSLVISSDQPKDTKHGTHCLISVPLVVRIEVGQLWVDPIDVRLESLL